MNSKNMITKNLCVYQDEAIGANPIPLAILGKDFRVSKSSDYFAKIGIVIDLKLDESGKIQRIQLGPDISVDLKTMSSGLEVGPFGLFPVHILQLAENFSSEEGGVIRFGFLKKIFVKESLTFTVKRVLSKLTGIQLNKAFDNNKDLSNACSSLYGQGNWGTFDISVKKNESGQWRMVTASNQAPAKTIEKLVARFNVNRAGIVLGIQEMYCQ